MRHRTPTYIFVLELCIKTKIQNRLYLNIVSSLTIASIRILLAWFFVYKDSSAFVICSFVKYIVMNNFKSIFTLSCPRLREQNLSNNPRPKICENKMPVITNLDFMSISKIPALC